MKSDNCKINSVCFRAKFIDGANLYERHRNKIKKVSAAIVQFDAENKKDLSCVNYIWANWREGFYLDSLNSVADNIADGICSNSDIYFITKQKKNFYKLNPSLITGYMLCKRKRINEIHIDTIERRNDYDGIGSGTSLINYLKKVYDKITLHSRDDEYTQKFYKNKDFIQTDEYSNTYTWTKNK